MNSLVIEHVRVDLLRLPESLDGLRVLHISDLHVGMLRRNRRVEAAKRMEELDPELVVFTGDAVNGRRHWDAAGCWLDALPIPPGVPRVAVPGNWDHYKGGEQRFRATMESAGFVPLLNESRVVECRGTSFQVVGFDDLRLGRFRPEAAWVGIDPGRFVLGLAHTPDMLLHVNDPNLDLLLSGHTHGGQIRLFGRGPMFTSSRLGARYASGLRRRVPEGWVYVSRGVGEGNVPFRIGCPPELALLTLGRILNHSFGEVNERRDWTPG